MRETIEWDWLNKLRHVGGIGLGDRDPGDRIRVGRHPDEQRQLQAALDFRAQVGGQQPDFAGGVPVDQHRHVGVVDGGNQIRIAGHGGEHALKARLLWHRDRRRKPDAWRSWRAAIVSLVHGCQ